MTGRRRRCGWLDLVALRYAARINGLTKLFITKLDILSNFEKLKVAVAYESAGADDGDPSGERHHEFPRQQTVLYHGRPVYEDFEGWNVDISDVRSYRELPEGARRYLEFIEDQVGVPIGWVSVGAERDQLIEK